MTRRVAWALFAVAMWFASAGGVLAQSGTTSSITGSVVDTDKGVIPGATVVARNNASGTSYSAVTGSAGVFTIPSIGPGVYTVTVSLQGFKTAVITEVRVSLGSPTNVLATLQIGSLEEKVEVVGGAAALVNTQTAAVSSTLNADQINKMPMPTRNLINAVTFLPGVNTSGINRDSNFNGLPDSFVAITLDGLNNNENYNKSTEGLFAMVTPRNDAIEQVTITTAGGGADGGGHGAVEIKFVTRSGTSRFEGSAYEYHRNPGLNTNYWFNENAGLGKNQVTLNQYGFRQGGPIVVPGLYDGRTKAFFFFNYEELRLPNDFTRNRTILNPLTQSGVYQYNVTTNGVTAVRQVNILDLARANGLSTALDPTVGGILNKIRAAVGTTGLVTQNTDPNTMAFTWLSPGNQVEKQPVTKIDYNLGTKHRITGTYNWQVVDRDPDHLNSGDVRFPGAPNYTHYVSYRPSTTGALRSTLSANVVNEINGGLRWGPAQFGLNDSSAPPTFADQGGYALGLGLGLTNWHTSTNPSERSAWSWQIDDSVTWTVGKHNLHMGGELYFGNVWVDNQSRAQSISFGLAQADPARAPFTAANIQGASTAQLGDAMNLYALLTGRVSSTSGQLALDDSTNQYVYLGKRRQAGYMNEYSLFVQDSWRTTPTLTLNAGVRWQAQMPFTPKNDVLSQVKYPDSCGISGVDASGECKFFQPGATGGTIPSFVEFTKGNNGYNTDWNNAAPNISAAWRPNVRSGWLRPLLGDPEQATLRAGYSVAYDRQGMAVFTGIFGGNPGSTLSVSKTEANGLLVPAGQSWPVLLSESTRLTLGQPCNGVVTGACNPGTVSFPIAVRGACSTLAPGATSGCDRSDSINVFRPDVQVSFARSYTASFQRAVTRDMAVDVRYVGTRGVNQWTTEAYNERNVLENGFQDEFKLAMANLQSNMAAGRGATFAYFGSGTGTSPLPIYLAYLNASKDAGNPTAYSGTNWTNTTFVGRLSKLNPSLASAASDLDGDAGRRRNAITAGLPSNFFVVNPDVNGVTVEVSDAFSGYDALQVELRRRLSHGLYLSGSYQYALENGSANLGKHYERVINPSANVRHAIKFQWNYEVPVGRGKQFGANMNKALDYVIGGWSVDGNGRVQARTLDFGSVRLVGMSVEELTKEYYYRMTDDPLNPGRKIVKMLPDDIILNTRRAFSTSATTASGYSDSLGAPEGRYIAPPQSATCITVKAGDCAPRTLLVRAPFFTRIDMSLSKKVPLGGHNSFEVRLDMLNVFDNINFNPVTCASSSTTLCQVTSAYTDTSNTFDPGGRLGQIVVRFNW